MVNFEHVIAGWVMTGWVNILGMSLITATLEIQDWWFSGRNGDLFLGRSGKVIGSFIFIEKADERVIIQDQIHEHKHEKAKWKYESYMNTKQLHEHRKINIKKLLTWTWKRCLRLHRCFYEVKQLECNSQSAISNRKTFTDRPVKK